MWTNYLKLGSLLLMAICTACHQNIDYIVKGDWIYINQTPHQISIQGKFENIILPAYGQDSIQITAGEGPKNVEPSNYVSPFEQCILLSIKEVYPKLVTTKQSKSVTTISASLIYLQIKALKSF